MLQILIITMREGIEAFLIVAITAGILRQTGRAALLPGAVLGNRHRRRRQLHRQPVLRASREQAALGRRPRRRRDRDGRHDDHLHVATRAHHAREHRRARSTQATQDKPTRTAWWAVFFFVMLMIVREGMETALLLIDAVPAARRSRPAGRRSARRRRRRVAGVGVDALRAPHQPRPLLPGHRDLPADLHVAARDLHVPRILRGRRRAVASTTSSGTSRPSPTGRKASTASGSPI